MTNEELESTFISNGEIWDFENESEESGETVKDLACHRDGHADIAVHLANKKSTVKHRKAIRCGGGYQVFKTIKAANYWEKNF